MKTHRETYPEQYTHPLVGKEVRIKISTTTGTVDRVVTSAQFGQLAHLTGSDVFWAVSDCEVI